jgi:hypothetical protein
VQEGVRLEVLDWGGSGRPLVLLAGGGDTAHVFDDFAPKLRPAFMSTESLGAASANPVSPRRVMGRTGLATMCSRSWTRSSWISPFSWGILSAEKR